MHANDNARAWYIAGQMTGYQDFNYPAFNAAAAQLRAMGYRVENPAENPEQPDWQGYMRAGITQLMRCGGIAMLPGWQQSRGASLEHFIAQRLGLQIVTVDELLKAAA